MADTGPGSSTPLVTATLPGRAPAVLDTREQVTLSSNADTCPVMLTRAPRLTRVHHVVTCSVFTMSRTECCLQVLVCPTRGGMDLQVRRVVAGRWAEAELLTRHDTPLP